LVLRTSWRVLKRDAVLRVTGTRSNVLEITPPLTLSEQEAVAAIELLNRALSDVAEDKVPDEVIEAFAGW
jgi:4-aminobutyrate aminotransferase